MDHKRGYDYLGSSDHGAPSPTKRRKECPVKQPVWPPQFGERHNAHNRINQYKTQIQNGCPQPGGPPLHAPESPSPAAEPIPSIPTRPVWVGGQKGLDLEKKIEEDLYQSLLPVVKKVGIHRPIDTMYTNVMSRYQSQGRMSSLHDLHLACRMLVRHSVIN